MLQSRGTANTPPQPRIRPTVRVARVVDPAPARLEPAVTSALMTTSHVDDLYRAEGDDAVVLHVHVQPGAGRSAVVGRHGAALKVRVAAAPEGGRANSATVEWMVSQVK